MLLDNGENAQNANFYFQYVNPWSCLVFSKTLQNIENIVICIESYTQRTDAPTALALAHIIEGLALFENERFGKFLMVMAWDWSFECF